MGDGYDIAVLKLDRKAKGLTLPRLGTSGVAITAGDDMAAIGWGMTESTDIAKTLRFADNLPINRQKYCKTPPNVTDSGSWICAGGRYEDTCKGNAHHRFHTVYGPTINTRLNVAGDSGGPLLLADSPRGHIKKGKPRFDMVVGITSYGFADDESGQCSGEEPAVYTSIDYFLDWIEKTIKGLTEVGGILANTTCRHRDRVNSGSRRSRSRSRRVD